MPQAASFARASQWSRRKAFSRCTAALGSPQGRSRGAPAAATLQDGRPVAAYDKIALQTQTGITVTDITPQLHQFIKSVATGAGQLHGQLSITSVHTTTGVCINEYEPRLVEDIRLWLARKAPPSDMYLHNDMDCREPPPKWEGTREEWIAQEPINAHSHLLSILVGSSETVPVMDGCIQIGKWQSVLLVDLDGPRTRNVALQFTGVCQS